MRSFSAGHRKEASFKCDERGEAHAQGDESVEGVGEINANQDVEDQALGISIDVDAYAEGGEHQGTDIRPQSFDMLSEQSELSFALCEKYQEAGTLGGSAGRIGERDTRLNCGEFPSRAFSAHSRLTKGIRVCETCMAVYSRIHLSLLEPGPSADDSAVLKDAAAARAAHAVCKPQQPDAGPADHDNPFLVDRYHHSRPSVLVGLAAAGDASRSKVLEAKHMLQPKGEAAAGRGASKSTTTSWRPAGVIAPASGTTAIRL
jgi:hypothetical protein